MIIFYFSFYLEWKKVQISKTRKKTMTIHKNFLYYGFKQPCIRNNCDNSGRNSTYTFLLCGIMRSCGNWSICPICCNCWFNCFRIIKSNFVGFNKLFKTVTFLSTKPWTLLNFCAINNISSTWDILLCVLQKKCEK